MTLVNNGCLSLEHSWSHAGNLICYNWVSYFTYVPCKGKSTLTIGYKYSVIPAGLQYNPLLALFSKRCRLVAIAICNAVKLIIFCASTVANQKLVRTFCSSHAYKQIWYIAYEKNEFAISVMALSLCLG